MEVRLHSLPKKYVARFPSVAGPFPVLFPEGCIPGSVSVRGVQVETFSPAVNCNRSCPEELLLLHLPANAQSLVIPQQVVALPVLHFPKVL